MTHIQEAERKLADLIIQQTLELGASVAGFAAMDTLRHAPSYQAVNRLPEWPATMYSVLIFGVAHPRQEPEHDWWDNRPGGTPGNRALMRIQKQLKPWLQDTFAIDSVSLPYPEDKGGIFLKDAAASAGLGVIGKNNLLLTPDYGAQIRWRAMFVTAELPTLGSSDFAPCDGCDQHCWMACPQAAFIGGRYDRIRCKIQMSYDEAHPQINDDGVAQIHYCRACELACPVA